MLLSQATIDADRCAAALRRRSHAAGGIRRGEGRKNTQYGGGGERGLEKPSCRIEEVEKKIIFLPISSFLLFAVVAARTSSFLLSLLIFSQSGRSGGRGKIREVDFWCVFDRLPSRRAAGAHHKPPQKGGEGGSAATYP